MRGELSRHPHVSRRAFRDLREHSSAFTPGGSIAAEPVRRPALRTVAFASSTVAPPLLVALVNRVVCGENEKFRHPGPGLLRP